ncbi:hypothetical protein F0562_000063 [Nyssa sinensis]|uniref:Reverse transcriptase zinc-binding domain-containing protein n=1 Tax=Nyssa sinensis TaxID=561372 RepID=A0A5J5BZL7_9ASTE|nr:hypothetical protein F0562_000063 [Nyssa sinensis]
MEFIVADLVGKISELVLDELQRLTGIKDQVELIEKELRLMDALVKQVKKEQPGDDLAGEWAAEAEATVRDVVDAIDTFSIKSARNRRRGVFKRQLLYLQNLEYRGKLSKKLDKIKVQMRDVSKRRPTGQQEPQPSSSQGGSSEPQPSTSQVPGNGITHMASSAIASVIEKIEAILSQNLIVHSGAIQRLKQINDEFTEVIVILNDVKPETELDERAKAWMEETKSVADFAENKFSSFLREENFRIPIPFLQLKDLKLRKDMEQICNKIQSLYEIKWRYGIVGINGREIPTSMFPLRRLFSSNAKRNVFSNMIALPIASAPLVESDVELLVRKSQQQLALLQPVEKQLHSIQRDLKMVRALVKDVDGRKDRENRVETWLDEVKDIQRDAEELDTLLNQARRGGMREINARRKVGKMIEQITNKIDEVSERKWKYDIEKIEGRQKLSTGDRRLQERESSAPDTVGRGDIGSTGEAEQRRQGLKAIYEAIVSFCSGKKLEEVEWIKSELKLMQAFFEDLESTEEQKARLKALVVELRGVEKYAQKFIDSYERCSLIQFKDRKEINRIKNRIREIWKRKRTYDIGGTRERSERPMDDHQISQENFLSFILKDLKSVQKLEENVGWINRELSLINALFEDVENIETLDETLKAWVDLMRVVAKDAETAINTYNEVTGQNGRSFPKRLKVAKKIESTMNKIQDVSEIRFVYGIQHIKRRLNPSVLSPGDLPLDLWSCFLYLGLFPVNFSIPVRRLIMLWIAEGLVRESSNDEVPPESVAKRHLEELISRGMVLVKEQKLNGDVKKCCLRDDLQSEAMKANFLKERTYKGSKSTLRLTDHCNPGDACFSLIHGNDTNPSALLRADYKDVISFLSFDTREGSKAGEEVGNFLDRSISCGFFLSLRVLDLERVFRPQLPKTLGQLITLRYLGLRWTYLEKLPSFISKLLNLQALDVKHTYISTLPSSIWKMEQLRHLYLNESYRCRFMRRPSRCYLTNLQTLWGAFIDEDSPVKNGLDTLTNLRKLGLACRIMSSQEEAMSSQLNAVADWVLKLKHLQSLRLKSYNELGEPGYLPLPNLTEHSSLSSIYLLGRLENPHVVSNFPENIIEVTLSASRLAEEPMQRLKELRKLRILRLFSKSYTGKNMLCSKGDFPQLRVLKLWNLERLEKWEVEIGALPNLEDLEIRSCENLKMLPDGLRHVRTLQKWKLPKMLNEFMDRIGRQDWGKIAHDGNINLEGIRRDGGRAKGLVTPAILGWRYLELCQKGGLHAQFWPKTARPNGLLKDRAETSFVHSSPIWEKLWMLNIHERRRTFLWRMYSDTLPSELPIGSITCPLCGAEPESAVHLFFLCKTAKMIWFSMWGIRTDFFSGLSISDWITHILNPSSIFGETAPRETYFLHSAVIIMEKTWLWRNKSIFNHAKVEPDLIYNEIRSAFNKQANAGLRLAD